MTALPFLPPSPVGFPDPHTALQEPDGLLAAGGDLTVAWLLEAYANGVFPWFDSDDEFILWWSPAKRAVLHPGGMHVSRSLAKRIRNAGFTLSMDTAFDAVVGACGAQRRDGSGTWITPRMRAAYNALHAQGYAHSVEVWSDNDLCGGLYGVSLGAMFFGESMFSKQADASKVAFHALQAQLARWQFELIDCQIMNPHLHSLGVNEISREEFLHMLEQNAHKSTKRGMWCFD
jgi:leucyl/phenylalanyl-tRNA--protein transferase